MLAFACSDDEDGPSDATRDAASPRGCSEGACRAPTPICDADTGECVECRTVADCAEHHDCVQSQCRVFGVCETSLDCEVDQVCDQTMDRCAQCIMEDDCDEGELCQRHRCQTPCTSDKDCTPRGLLCDRASGACVSCVDDRACGESMHCDMGACVPDGCHAGEGMCDGGQPPHVCEPGATRCSGSSILRCAEDGSSEERVVDCGDEGQTCQAGECVAVTRCERVTELCADEADVEIDCEAFVDAPAPVLDCVDAALGCDAVIACVLDTTPGTTCLDEESCEVGPSCSALLAGSPDLPDGLYGIDIDGEGPEPGFEVYCDMTTSGGGWQLISVSRDGDEAPLLVGPGYCTSLSIDPACKGQMHPAQVTDTTEILIRDLQDGKFLIYRGFSASARSALRFFSLQLKLADSQTCIVPGGTCGCDDPPCDCSDHDNVCNTASIDPSLAIAETSGFTYDYDPPLYQWWRHGGWYVGAQPRAPFLAEGNVHATQYGTSHQLSARADADVATVTAAASGHQAIFHRQAKP